MSSERHERVASGKLIVISGPSGAGKTSICKGLLAASPAMVWSVSATTRPQRPGDVPGESYEFLTEEEFARREAAGEFLESAVFIGHHYGTPCGPIRRALSAGRDVIMEIDVQGGVQVATRMPESVRIFVLPPDHDSLRARLTGRRTEAQDQLDRRLAQADGEIAFARDSGCYQYFVVNDILETTIEAVKSILVKEKSQA
ncbi:MAG: guanylate kinase [Phycisphaerae bacterium]